MLFQTLIVASLMTLSHAVECTVKRPTVTNPNCFIELHAASRNDQDRSDKLLVGGVEMLDRNFWRGVAVAVIDPSSDCSQTSIEVTDFDPYAKDVDLARLSTHLSSIPDGKYVAIVVKDTAIKRNDQQFISDLDPMGVPAKDLKFREALAAVFMKGCSDSAMWEKSDDGGSGVTLKAFLI